jgi:hypothetical protein
VAVFADFSGAEWVLPRTGEVQIYKPNFQSRFVLDSDSEG